MVKQSHVLLLSSDLALDAEKMIVSECKFSSIKHGFTGKPDLILRRADGLVIIDYKSSELSDDTQNREEIIQLW